MSGNGFCNACNLRAFRNMDELAYAERLKDDAYGMRWEIIDGQGQRTGVLMFGDTEKCQPGCANYLRGSEEASDAGKV